MMPLELALGGRRALRILCLGAHSDDIEIGCGGTIARVLASNPCVQIRWVVFSATEGRDVEAQRSADRLLRPAACAQVSIEDFRDGFFPYSGGEIKERFERLKAEPVPDIIFTHHGLDAHQDHRVISELTWNTFRHHFILEYEIPKYDGGLRTPNMFVPLDDRARRLKLDVLMDEFGTQRDKRWFTESLFDGLMRLRGVECASPTGYAEGFHSRKATFALSGDV
jgi:LmbE family N-acetylglucosaminyl deacetylase